MERERRSQTCERSSSFLQAKRRARKRDAKRQTGATRSRKLSELASQAKFAERIDSECRQMMNSRRS